MKKLIVAVAVLLVIIIANEVLSWLCLLMASGLFLGKLYQEAEK